MEIVILVVFVLTHQNTWNTLEEKGYSHLSCVDESVVKFCSPFLALIVSERDNEEARE
jgi:hypothetical protein